MIISYNTGSTLDGTDQVGDSNGDIVDTFNFDIETISGL